MLSRKLLFDIETASFLLSLPTRKVAKAIVYGELQAIWVCGQLLIPRASLLAFAGQ